MSAEVSREMRTEANYLPPVECMPWCSYGDGHPAEWDTADQNCYSADNYLYLPLNERDKGTEGFCAQIGVAAKREIGFLPCVHVHLTLMDPDVDCGVKFTPAEARWLAAELLRTADLVDGSGQQQNDPGHPKLEVEQP